MSCKVGGLISLLSKVTPIVNMISFQPPKHCLYDIDEKDKKLIDQTPGGDQSQKFFSTRELYLTSFTHVNYFPLHVSEYKWFQTNSYIIKKKKDKSGSVVVLHILNKSILDKIDNEPFTILHSHGNATTLGIIYPFLIDLSTQLQCHVISYDYNGYGKSKGKPSEVNVTSNADDVYSFMRYYLNIKPKQIIIYGYSIGTVPSCDIASKQSVAGLILHAPIASGRLLIEPEFELNEDNIESDSFCNWARVSNINCPTFIMHGIEDGVIPYDHSILLEKRLLHLMKWYPKKGNHSNIYDNYRSKFIDKTKKFLRLIKADYEKEDNEKKKKNNKQKSKITNTPLIPSNKDIDTPTEGKENTPTEDNEQNSSN